ncbi:SWIM zinc finger family protein [Actinopolyspora mortivallis]|uniref:SWIM zinc finger family protein n=1 Tax=Actinopolyspora mortivallis TaxID=33906 RepID=UPI0003662589|nr:SWIM zinc finger family protein [Actinopolyspora mortivallis]
MNSEFGTTAWGRDWRRLAEPTSLTRPDPALPKARSLARRDHVTDVELRPGEITAVVHHSGSHRVRVDMPVWDREHVERARELVTGHGDDLPDTVHSALVRAGQPPAPQPDVVTTNCDCTGRKRPCVHILAAFFEIARQLDHRPRLALALRGVEDSHSPPSTARVPIGLLDPTDFYGETGR